MREQANVLQQGQSVPVIAKVSEMAAGTLPAFKGLLDRSRR